MTYSPISSTIDTTYRLHSRQVFASLVRLLGDFDLAEDALHEAFKAALEKWPNSGVPANPIPWLISAGRFKAIDTIRRQSKFDSLGDRIDEVMAIPAPPVSLDDLGPVEDERLRLIFTCCHPSLSPDAQIALTLREVCGLTTEEIAHAFLTPASTLAQRIVRAKSKIREARIPFTIPEPDELPSRLNTALRVVYLVFNEGYSAHSGEAIYKTDLASEAIRLARLIAQLLPHPEVDGLLALMLLHHARASSRATTDGDLIPLEEQDRTLWDQALIAEGSSLVESALRSRRFGAYSLQAAISALHCQASSYADTDWSEIVGIYQALLALEPSPIVELNLAVALAMANSPAAAIPRIDTLIETGGLNSYHLAHAARGYLYLQLGNSAQARASYQTALSLAKQEPERRFLRRKLAAIES